MNSISKPNAKICLIGGTGRSGTTIFRRVFNNHPKATGIPEFRITLDPDGLIDFYSSMHSHWTPYLFDKKLKKLKELLLDAGHTNPLAKYYRYGLKKTNLSKAFVKLETRYTDIGIDNYCPDYKQIVLRLINNLVKFKYRGTWTGQYFGERAKINFNDYTDKKDLASQLGNFYRDIVNAITDVDKTTHFIDDNTWNILYFPQLLELLPEAKLVHIYRDPRDVTASYMTQSWAPSDAKQAALLCRSILDRWDSIRSTLADYTYREIALEEFANNTKKVLPEIAKFWEMEWDDSLLEFDLSKSNQGRWKQDIPDEKKAEIQAILKKHIKDYGYEDN